MLLQWNCSARGRAHICLTPKNIPSVTGTCMNCINDVIMGNMLTPNSSCTLRCWSATRREIVPGLVRLVGLHLGLDQVRLVRSLRCERGRVADAAVR